MGLYHCITFLLFCTSLKTIQSLKNTEASTKMDYTRALNQTVHAIEKLLLFYEDQINEVNLDAIYGLRVTEGALSISLREHSKSFWNAFETSYSYEKIRKLKEQAGSINNRAQTSIKNQAENYYHKFKNIVSKPWTFFEDFGYRKLPVNKVQVVEYGAAETEWDEETSDRCMSEVMGTNANHTECTFTPLCVKAITDRRQEAYGPTHQILFLTLALMHGCQQQYSEVLKQHLGYGVDGLIENRCVRVMSEMIGIEQPYVKKTSRDLYMEQGFVCAMHGYGEFLSLKRLKNILSWQRQVGCFGNLTDEDEDEDEDDIQDDEEQTGIFSDNEEEIGALGVNRKKRSTLEGDVVVRSRRNGESFKSMRRLLVDVSVAHGCSAHESGVAAGLLGLYTKWLLIKLDTSVQKPTTVPIVKTHETSLPKNNPTTGDNDTQKKHMTAKTNSPKSKNIPSTSSKSYPTNGHNNIQKNNMTAKTVYIRSMIISFLTSLLTVSAVLTLYKLGENFCTRRRSTGKYRPLVDA